MFWYLKFLKMFENIFFPFFCFFEKSQNRVYCDFCLGKPFKTAINHPQEPQDPPKIIENHPQEFLETSKFSKFPKKSKIPIIFPDPTNPPRWCWRDCRWGVGQTAKQSSKQRQRRFDAPGPRHFLERGLHDELHPTRAWAKTYLMACWNVTSFESPVCLRHVLDGREHMKHVPRLF